MATRRPRGDADAPHDNVNGGDVDAGADGAAVDDGDVGGPNDNANAGADDGTGSDAHGAQSTVDDDPNKLPDPHIGPNRSSIAHLRLDMKEIGILQPSYTFETFVSDFVQKSNKKFFLYFPHTR